MSESKVRRDGHPILWACASVLAVFFFASMFMHLLQGDPVGTFLSLGGFILVAGYMEIKYPEPDPDGVEGSWM